ncbi:MAG: pirin family protein [Thiotrichaceae bacterium]
MLILRPASERGHFQNDWLDSYHSFSFAEYHDPNYMNFRSLRVINDDRIAPGGGFAMHGHRDMEIITYVISGELAHKDSLGNGSVIRRGEIQYMSAGSGIRHSEYNPSSTQPVHLLQIWIQPAQPNLPPNYQQHPFQVDNQGLTLIAAGDTSGLIQVHQQIQLYAGMLQADESLDYSILAQRHVWIQGICGIFSVNEQILQPGDGIAISQENMIQIKAQQRSEFLLFDLN